MAEEVVKTCKECGELFRTANKHYRMCSQECRQEAVRKTNAKKYQRQKEMRGPARKRGPKLRGPTSDRDFKLFENLCEIQCTPAEIAAAFDCHLVTLTHRIKEKYGDKFYSVYKVKRANGRKSLRRAQWENAIDNKNTQMQIHLGKTVLGQNEKVIHVEGEDDEGELTYEEIERELEEQLDTLSRSLD